MFLCLFIAFFLFFGLVYFSRELLVLQDLEWCIRGRVVTVSDLKEVLRAKTEEKDRRTGSKERSYRGGELLLSGMSCQTTVNTNKNCFKKTKQTDCLRRYFLFIFDLGPFLEESFFFGCWGRERERDCDVVVTFWSHNSHKTGGKDA